MQEERADCWELLWVQPRPGPAGGGGDPAYSPPAGVQEQRPLHPLQSGWLLNGAQMLTIFLHWIFSLLSNSSYSRGHCPSNLAFKAVCGDNPRGYHDPESHGLWFGVCLSSIARDDEKQKEVLTKVSEEPRPLSETHLEVEEGQSHRFTGAPWRPRPQQRWALGLGIGDGDSNHHPFPVPSVGFSSC